MDADIGLTRMLLLFRRASRVSKGNWQLATGNW